MSWFPGMAQEGIVWRHGKIVPHKVQQHDVWLEFLGQSNRPPSSASPTTWMSGSCAAVSRRSARIGLDPANQPIGHNFVASLQRS